MPEPTAIERADQAMKERRFSDAIAAFEEHLAESPDDVRALLRLGICHLLGCSEEAFLAIHPKAQALISRTREVPEDLARLWAHYNDLLRKVSATALVMGSMALPACQTPPAQERVRPVAIDAASEAQPTPKDEAAPEPSPAGVDAGVAAPTIDPDEIRPAHRYSGGVRPRPTPDLERQ